MRLAAFAFALLLPAAAPPSFAQAPIPLHAPPALAGLTEANRAFHARWITYNLGRAIAFGPNGAAWGAWGNSDTEAAKSIALQRCAERAGAPCTLYAVDLTIVAPGAGWAPPAAPPARLGIGNMAWEITPDARYLWHGPEAARGAIVFGHGLGTNNADYRGNQPQGWVRHFNVAGFDVFRFDRHPNSDEANRAAAWLREGLGQLRAQGYRRIVMSGQSRGGWNTLQVLDTPGLVDVAIAIAAAAHGSGGSMNLGAQNDQLRSIADRANAPGARVAFVQFAYDPFMTDFETRARIMREAFARRVAAVLVLDRPEGFTGHAAGHQWQFADRFGPCLVAFATEPTPRSAC